MKLTTAKIREINAALDSISTQSMPGDLSFKIASLKLQIGPIVTLLREHEEKLVVEKYGILTDDKTQYIVPPQNMREYIDEINVVLQVTHQINVPELTAERFLSLQVPPNFFLSMNDIFLPVKAEEQELAEEHDFVEEDKPVAIGRKKK